MYLDLVGNITNSVTIPVAVKLGPNFSALANFAHRLTGAGARGLVLFNRFYQPQIDLQTLTVEPTLRLSNSHELPERLRWTAILRDQIDADIAITGGIHNRDDILKAIMAGASVAMTTSALLRHGIPYAGQMLASLSTWMQELEYVSVAQMRGSISHRTVSDTDAFERANYMNVLRSFVHKS
jgi:dihydroorotate dehydrogenase (fumarate)